MLILLGFLGLSTGLFIHSFIIFFIHSASTCTPSTVQTLEHNGNMQTDFREREFGFLALTLTNGEISGKSFTVFSFSCPTCGGMRLTNSLLRGLEIIFTERQAYFLTQSKHRQHYYLDTAPIPKELTIWYGRKRRITEGFPHLKW